MTILSWIQKSVFVGFLILSLFFFRMIVKKGGCETQRNSLFGASVRNAKQVNKKLGMFTYQGGLLQEK